MAFSGSLNFITASDFGTYRYTGNAAGIGPNARFFGSRQLPVAVAGYVDFIPVDFVGLNTIIVEPITGSENYLGYPIDVQVATYNPDNYAWAYFNGASSSWGNINPGIASINNDADDILPGGAVGLNSILLNRNGPYQHPSWKQYRGGDHPVARYIRLNNTMSVDLNDPDAIVRERKKRALRDEEEIFVQESIIAVDGAETSPKTLYQIRNDNIISNGIEEQIGKPPVLKRYYHPALTTKHKPLVYTANVGGSEIKVRASLMNQMMGFSSDGLEDKISGSTNKSAYSILHMATSGDFPAQQFIYSERIYPKEINSYRDYKLERPNYEQVAGLGPNGYDVSLPRLFWKDDQGSGLSSSAPPTPGKTRLRTNAAALNSMGTIQTAKFPEDYSLSAAGTARRLISGSTTFVSSAYVHQSSSLGGYLSVSPGTTAAAITATGAYGIRTSTTNNDLGLEGLVVEYVHNGVVINRRIWDREHTFGQVSATFWQMDAYQPYQIPLLSSWPLDVPAVVFDSADSDTWKVIVSEGGTSANHLSSALGGNGQHIGLTPMSNNTHVSRSAGFSYVDALTRLSGAQGLHAGPWAGNGLGYLPLDTGSVVGIGGASDENNAYTTGARTGSAGELSYSTKPSIFFWRGSPTHTTSSIRLTASADVFNMGAGRDHLSPLLLFDGSHAGPSKFELEDAQGNKVAFHFITGSSRHDGRTTEASGSIFVEIGIDHDGEPMWSVGEYLQRVATAVNSVNSYDNDLTLNISASWITSSDNGTMGIDFHQTTPGTGQRFKMNTGSYSSDAGGMQIACKHNLYGLEFVPNAHGEEYFMGNNIGPEQYQYPDNGTAGWLVTSSLYDDGMLGYKNPTASLQYNRHTFPYNTPFYTTDRVRERSPFYDSYNEYSDNFKYLGRDFSLVPEYRYSEHINFYHKIKYASKLNSDYNSPLFLRKPSFSYREENGEYVTDKRDKWTRSTFLVEIGQNISSQKANFLAVEGGDHSSSSDLNEYKSPGTALAKRRYEYDDILGAQQVDNSGSPMASYLSNQQSVDFYGRYGITDSTVGFSDLIDQDNMGFEDDVDTIPKTVTFKASAIKKLLPYNGFYPALRTVQIGNAFKSDITGSKSYVGRMDSHPPGQQDYDDSYTQTLLEPFMAPGLLYNSIKSGIAVDYPVYWSKPKYYMPHEFVAPSGTVEQNTVHGLQPQALSSSYHGGLWMMGASRCMPSILTSLPEKRLPFKSLYNMSTLESIFAPSQDDTNSERPFMHLVSDFVDLDRWSSIPAVSPQTIAATRQGELNVGNPHIQLPDQVGIQSLVGQTYHSSINNYLSETMEFFLADLDAAGSKLPVAMSKISKDGLPAFTSEAEHLMEVSLAMGSHHVSCEGPRDAGIGSNTLLNEDGQVNDASIVYITIDDWQAIQPAAEQVISLWQGLSGSVPCLPGGPCGSAGGFRSFTSMRGASSGSITAGQMALGLFLPETSSIVTAGNLMETINTQGYFTATWSGNNVVTVYQKYRGEYGNSPSYGHGALIGGEVTDNHPGLTVTAFELGGAEGYFFKNSSMRGYIYGPPTEIVPHAGAKIGSDFSEYRFDRQHNFIDTDDFSGYIAANIQDPAYHAYTPPYFYGKSSYIYKFVPTSIDSFEGKKISELQTDLKKSTVSYFADRYDDPVSGSRPSSILKVDASSLSLTMPNTGSVSKGSTAKMRINSSVDVHGDIVGITVDGQDTDIWAISPEWVCPVLDFSSSYTTVQEKKTTETGEIYYSNLSITNSFHDPSTGRGMWGGYGTDPYDASMINKSIIDSGYTEADSDGNLTALPEYSSGKGIYFEVGDFTLISNEKYDQLQTSGFLSNQDKESQYATAGDQFSTESLSLGEHLGFHSKDEKLKIPIGKFASEKTIHEAIVLVPYVKDRIKMELLDAESFTTQDGLGDVHDDVSKSDSKGIIYQTREVIPGIHFLPIQERVFENILSLHISQKRRLAGIEPLGKDYGEDWFEGAIDPQGMAYTDMAVHSLKVGAIDRALNTDVGKMIEHLSSFSDVSFVLPPEMDFVHNSAVAPFQVVVMPFEHTLDKQELVDIYQGILPDSGLQTEFIGGPNRKSKVINTGQLPAAEANLYVPKVATATNPAGVALNAHAQEALLNFLSPKLFMVSNELKLSQDSVTPYKTAKDFYKNLRFMVFRVKQRAKKDYKNYRNLQIAKSVRDRRLIEQEGANLKQKTAFSDALGMKTVGDIFGANWPYDYFSLIDTAKIDIEFEVDET